MTFQCPFDEDYQVPPMPTDSELLQDIRDRVVKMETKLDIYFGEGGTIPVLQKVVDALKNRVYIFLSVGGILGWLAEKGWTQITGGKN